MARPDRLVRQLLRDRLVLTMRGGETFEGVVLDADDKTVKVADAYVLGENSRTVVDGELYLPRAELAYMQRPKVERG